MASQQYSVRDLLPIRGDGVARPGAPEAKPIPAAIAKVKAKFAEEKEEPRHAFGEELYATVLRKLHAVGEKWAAKPYLPENFHKAMEEVCAVLGGQDGLPALSAEPTDDATVTCDIYRDGKHQPLPVDCKASFDFAHARRDYRKLRNATTTADHQVKEDD